MPAKDGVMSRAAEVGIEVSETYLLGTECERR
jgi:hypothetical protein